MRNRIHTEPCPCTTAWNPHKDSYGCIVGTVTKGQLQELLGGLMESLLQSRSLDWPRGLRFACCSMAKLGAGRDRELWKREECCCRMCAVKFPAAVLTPTVNTRLTFGAFTGLLILFCVLPEKAHRLESSWPTTKRGISARPKVTNARPIRWNVWADEPVACVAFEGPRTNRTPEKPQKRRLVFFSDLIVIPW